MSISAITPKIYAARFLSFLDKVNVWGNLTNSNYEGEITSSGDSISIPTFTKTITVSDYNEDGTLGERLAEAEEVTATDQTLAIDFKKAVHYLIEDIEAVQAKPNLADAAMSRAGVAVSNAVDTYLRGVFDKSFDGTYTQITGANDSARNTNITARTVDIAVSNTIDAANGAFGGLLISALAQLKNKMSAANIPEEGRWLVVHPDTILGLDLWLTAKNTAGVYVPAAQDSGLRNGFAGRLLGFDLRVTTAVSSVQQSAANDSWQLVAGQGAESVTMARQLIRSEMYRPERSFADAFKSLYVAGARNVLPERLYRIRHKKA